MICRIENRILGVIIRSTCVDDSWHLAYVLPLDSHDIFGWQDIRNHSAAKKKWVCKVVWRVFFSAFYPVGRIDDHQICILYALPKRLFDCTVKVVGTGLVAFDALNVSNAACVHNATLKLLYFALTWFDWIASLLAATVIALPFKDWHLLLQGNFLDWFEL